MLALNLLAVVPVAAIGSKVMRGVRSIKVADEFLDLSASAFKRSKAKIRQLAGKIFNAEKYVEEFGKTTGIKVVRVSDDVLKDKAKKWQGSGDYPGVDDWEVVEIPAGTKVLGGIPGHGNQPNVWSAGCKTDFKNPEHKV